MRPACSRRRRRLWRDAADAAAGPWHRGRRAVLAGVDAGVRTGAARCSTAARVPAGRAGRRGPRRRPRPHAGSARAAAPAPALLEDAGDRGRPPVPPDPSRARPPGARPRRRSPCCTGRRPAARSSAAGAVDVLVVGAGRVGAPLAAAARAARASAAVDVDDDGLTRAGTPAPAGSQPSDVGRSARGGRAPALRAAALSAAAAPPAARPRRARTDRRARDERGRRLVLRQGTPHLLVEVREPTGVVGPLVLPGRTRLPALPRPAPHRPRPGLARARRPAGAGRRPGRRLRRPARRWPSPRRPPMQVLASSTARRARPPLGGTLELALPDWRCAAARWPPHPRLRLCSAA